MDERIKASRKQEKDAARRYGGRVNSGSGNGEKFKSDVRTATELLELKTTRAASYKLSIAELALVWLQALADDRQPVFGIEFQKLPPDAFGGTPRKWVLMPEDDYLAMRERAPW